MIGGKLAIMSSKPQTTRTEVQGVLTLPNAQIVFVDTPGIHEAPSLLDRRMMDAVRSALEDRDVVLLVADCMTTPSDDDRHAVDLIRGLQSPVFLVLNKVDRLDDKRQLLPRIEQ